MAKSYYEILGVLEDADELAIRSGYRKAVKDVHPDLNPDNRKSQKRIRELNVALETLLNPALREQYDEKLKRLRKTKGNNRESAAPKETTFEHEPTATSQCDQMDVEFSGGTFESTNTRGRKSQSDSQRKRRRRSRTLLQSSFLIFSIALGGIAAICVSVLFLWLAWQQDPLGLFEREMVSAQLPIEEFKREVQTLEPQNGNQSVEDKVDGQVRKPAVEIGGPAGVSNLPTVLDNLSPTENSDSDTAGGDDDPVINHPSLVPRDSAAETKAAVETGKPADVSNEPSVTVANHPPNEARDVVADGGDPDRVINGRFSSKLIKRIVGKELWIKYRQVDYEVVINHDGTWNCRTSSKVVPMIAGQWVLKANKIVAYENSRAGETKGIGEESIYNIFSLNNDEIRAEHYYANKKANDGEVLIVQARIPSDTQSRFKTGKYRTEAKAIGGDSVASQVVFEFHDNGEFKWNGSNNGTWRIEAGRLHIELQNEDLRINPAIVFPGGFSGTFWDSNNKPFHYIGTLVKLSGVKKNKKPEEPNTLKPRTSNTTLNLLPLIDAKNDGLVGNWTKDKNGISIMNSGGRDKLVIPFVPRGDYEIEMEFIRTQGNNSGIIVPISGVPCLIALCGKGKTGRIELRTRRAEQVSESFATKVVSNDVVHKLWLRVENGSQTSSVRATLDGDDYLNCTVKTEDLWLLDAWELPDKMVLGLIASNVSTTIRSFTIRELPLTKEKN